MNANEILEMMRKGMGEVPAAIEKSVPDWTKTRGR